MVLCNFLSPTYYFKYRVPRCSGCSRYFVYTKSYIYICTLFPFTSTTHSHIGSTVEKTCMREKFSIIMDILLLGCYIFSNKVKLAAAKITMSFIHPSNPILSPTTGWTNWLINEFHVSNLNFSPEQYPRIFYIYFHNFGLIRSR